MNITNSIMAIDITEVVAKYKDNDRLIDIYRTYPLNEIVESMLSVNPFIDYSDLVYYEIDRRFCDVYSAIDIFLFEVFYEALAEDLDACIYKHIQVYTNNTDDLIYIFEKWLDPNSMLVRIS
jgi:hypothetical protein